MPLFYISFAKAGVKDGFLGATVVEAPDVESAVMVADALGVNPGGEAMILPLPDEAMQEPDCKAMFNKLLDREAMEAQRGVRTADLPKKMRAWVDADARFVCSCCNPPRRH